MEKSETILNEWVGAVNRNNIESILSFYDKSAILIPTFSNRIMNTPEKIRIYFEQFRNREDLNVSLHENTIKIQNVTEDIYIISGIYTWYFSVENEPLTFEARFSLLLNTKLNGPIVHHHSSQIPRML
jgi:hypothetical protein